MELDWKHINEIEDATVIPLSMHMLRVNHCASSPEAYLHYQAIQFWKNVATCNNTWTTLEKP